MAASAAVPVAAQQTEVTTETTISFAANSSSEGFLLAITPPDEPEPAVAVTAATTEGRITSDGPGAEGFGEVASLLGETAGRAETSAPPDDTDHAQSNVPSIDVPLDPLGAVQLGVIQGDADSASEAEDGLPSTENDATFSGVTIDAGLELPDPLGSVGADIGILESDTFSNAAATGERHVRAEAAATGLSINANLDVEGLAALCAELPSEPIDLRSACEALVGVNGESEPLLLDITLGPSRVGCTWNGTADEADCDGEAMLATIELLGQDPIEVAPGETVTIPPDPAPTDPFVVRISAGTFEEESGTNPTSASAVASGLSVELLGAEASGPGLITLQIGQSTAAVSGKVETKRIIARTGAPLLPILLGGTVLVAAGVGLRRFLKRA